MSVLPSNRLFHTDPSQRMSLQEGDFSMVFLPYRSGKLDTIYYPR